MLAAAYRTCNATVRVRASLWDFMRNGMSFSEARKRSYTPVRYFDTFGTLKYEDSLTYASIHIDPTIGKYLRRLYNLSCFKTAKLLPPMWGMHVCVIRNEAVATALFDNSEMCVRIWLMPIETNGNAWYAKVYSEAGEMLRRRLGLPKLTQPFHLCIGYERDGKNYANGRVD